jgi:L-asparaginase
LIKSSFGYWQIYTSDRNLTANKRDYMDICIINTGGTISCIGEPLAPMSAAEFATASQTILNPIVAETFPDTTLFYETALTFPESSTGTLDSTNLQPSDWCLMAQYILDNYATYDGFVILHGTDSMDFTGSALPFLLNVFDAQGFGTAVLSKPVIVTGSQVPMFYQAPTPPSGPKPALTLNFNTDAYQNFCGSVAAARLGIPEVGVYFDSKLYRGDRVLKINASEFRAFDSPNYPALAEYGIEMTQYGDLMLPGPVGADVSLDNATALAAAKTQLTAITAAIDSNPVMQLPAFPAPYSVPNATAVIADLITACAGQGIKGLVLESYGEGNFPSGNPDHPAGDPTATPPIPAGAIYTALEAANTAGTIIVDSTQVIAGTVNNSAYASGAWLPNVGALSASDMTPMASLTKTMILLSAATANGWTADQVKTLIQLNLFGEIMNVSRLDSRTNATLLPGQSIMALDGSAKLINDPSSGPIMTASDGTFLWAPFGSAAAGKPGRLVMQNDGNLVLYNASHTALWATNMGDADGGSSVLMITGSTGATNLTLSVYNYSAKSVSATLYPQS